MGTKQGPPPHSTLGPRKLLSQQEPRGTCYQATLQEREGHLGRPWVPVPPGQAWRKAGSSLCPGEDSGTSSVARAPGGPGTRPHHEKGQIQSDSLLLPYSREPTVDVAGPPSLTCLQTQPGVAVRIAGAGNSTAGPLLLTACQSSSWALQACCPSDQWPPRGQREQHQGAGLPLSAGASQGQKVGE